ncbi:uncharacterized protein LOC132737333 isoform X1 [Ruditapes philippinarum]|uniref:uncharacterized protein LOC132737333 isoform X1 n=1 Tax=Ruditapes philippinarum TaxID=129788 RepID=UPI00295B9B3E|nr:uncharacterized protein LOC132737333 isoform X1 [Ruditapes philippinarum]
MFKHRIVFLVCVTLVVANASSMEENRSRRLIFDADNNLTSTTRQPLSTQTSTTSKQPWTKPPVTTMCAVCSGPKFLCEKLFAHTPCSPPNNYCINKIINHLDGTKTVERSCGNFSTCYREWYLGSSDSDTCRAFHEDDPLYLDFECTYCCVSDNCNFPLHPSGDTLYKDV